jgi:CDP-paratose 2-epimerase
MKILVTGGCGFVGSSISIHLRKSNKKNTIYTLDNFSRKGSRINYLRLKKNNIKNYNLDIIDKKKVLNLPKFDLIIDCCAEAAVADSIKKPEKVFHTNLVGTFNILSKCIKDNSKIIFLSSSRVYSINSLKKNININKITKKKLLTHSINEKFDTSSPKSLYGFTKLSSEDLIKEASYSHGIKYIINRFGVISGPWQFGYEDQGFVSLWVICHIIKKNLKYIGFNASGNQCRDVIHINDVCEIVQKQIQKINIINNDTFNIGGGIKSFISLKDLTKMCEIVTGNVIKFSKVKKTSLFDIPTFLTNNYKIKKFYNWKPSKTITNIVNDTYTWAIKNKKDIMRVYK